MEVCHLRIASVRVPPAPVARDAFNGTNQCMRLGRNSLLVRNFADPGVVPDDQFTRVESTRLEIIGVGCKQPPTADVFAHDSHRSGVRESA